MPIALQSRVVVTAFDTVSFFMADEDRTIRVDVGKELLARIEGPPSPSAKSGFIERLVRHRRQFAQIAAFKYDNGQYHPEVRVLVVRITEDDLTA